MDLQQLPTDILILVFELLEVQDLIALSSTCKQLHSTVSLHGWAGYLRVHPRLSWSLTKSRTKWSPRTRVLYDVASDTAWTRSSFVARPLCRMWFEKHSPALAINEARLVIGAGSTLYLYAFSDRAEITSPAVTLEGTISLADCPSRLKVITAITFLSESPEPDRTLLVAFQDGTTELIILNPATSPEHENHPSPISITRSTIFSPTQGDYLECVRSRDDILLSFSSKGVARLYQRSRHESDHHGFIEQSSIELKSRGWTSHLCLDSPSTPFALFGSTSRTPLAMHLISESQLMPNPSFTLHTHKAVEAYPTPTVDLSLTERPQQPALPSSAVYGISRGPPNSPWGSSPLVIASGWFDGQVRIYDLRSSSRYAKSDSSSSTSTLLRPVLSLADKWSYEAIYSLSCSGGGGTGSHIAAGTARNSVVSFWDVRAPKQGWGVHAPGNDASPVYDIALESSRVFGVTQSRGFVFDFGPGVTLDTYPPIPPVKGIDNLRHKRGSHPATYHVVKYAHHGPGTPF